MVELTLRGRRRLLRTLATIFTAGIAASLCAAFLLPLDERTVKAPAPTSETKLNDPAETDPSPRPLKDYAVIHGRDLRKPLFDPEPVKQTAPAKPPRPLRVTLVGTATDPGCTYGLFRKDKGEVQLAGVGETVDDAEITAITESSATVRFDGRTITLEVPGKDRAP